VPYSINGVGTAYYGSALPRDDGSCVVTEWIIFFGIPLIPLGSKRVWYVSQERRPVNQTVTQYKVARVPLHIPHLVKGYAVTGGLFLIAEVIDYFHW